MTGEVPFKILDQTRMISGKLHRMVERRDGFRFYLDEAFLFALQQPGSPDLAQALTERGAAEEEVETILRILQMAGLLELSNND